MALLMFSCQIWASQSKNIHSQKIYIIICHTWNVHNVEYIQQTYGQFTVENVITLQAHRTHNKTKNQHIYSTSLKTLLYNSRYCISHFHMSTTAI